jgi:hypothetical protein
MTADKSASVPLPHVVATAIQHLLSLCRTYWPRTGMAS